MTKYMPFYYDEKCFFQNDKSFFITGKHLAFLTAFFNSSLFKFCFKDNFPELLGNTRELRKIFFDKIPVLKITDKQNDEFCKLVNKAQKEPNDKNTQNTIEQMIYNLYGLTLDEVAFIVQQT